MNLQQWACVLAAALLLLVVIFQLLLAAGRPLGAAAWGGGHRVLPTGLRWASLASAGVLGLIGWVALARADLVAPGSGQLGARVTTWVVAGLLLVNTIGNAASKSPTERKLMTPTTLLLVVCFVVLALSPVAAGG